MTTADGFQEGSISIVRDAEGLKLLRADRVSVTGRDIAALIASANDLGEDGPLVLPPKVSLDLAELTRAEKREFINALEPSHDVWCILEGQQDPPDDFEGMKFEAPVTETGITIDGRAWGWFPYWAGPWGKIFPAGREIVLWLEMAFHGDSMTSGTTWIGISGVGDLAALSYRWDTENNEYQVEYLIDDWVPLISDALAPGEPMCPACEEAKDWGISFGTSLPVSTEVLGKAMTGLWRPCDEHEGLGKQLTVTANSGYEWHWDGQVWVAR